jgi:glycosyltransferase involved in cell wall biosynthesis
MPVIGIVMTNQIRKDWGLAFGVIAELKQYLKGNLYVWCKTDSIDRHWDLRALAADFNVGDVVNVDLNMLSDKSMSYMYSMCDLTFLPSLGEGFGYPIVESMACGVPCITGSYGGGAELVTDKHTVKPVTYRYEATCNSVRPVYSPGVWAQVILRKLEHRLNKDDVRRQVEYLNWPNLHTVWERWFREGVQWPLKL